MDELLHQIQARPVRSPAWRLLATQRLFGCLSCSATTWSPQGLPLPTLTGTKHSGETGSCPIPPLFSILQRYVKKQNKNIVFKKNLCNALRASITYSPSSQSTKEGNFPLFLQELPSGSPSSPEFPLEDPARNIQAIPPCW